MRATTNRPPTPSAQPEKIVPLFPPDPIPEILLGGSVNLLASPPNTGKTAFLSTFLRKLYLGEEVYGERPNKVPQIAIISVDRSWHQSSQRWFQLAGWAEADLRYYCLQDDLEFDVKKLLQKNRRMEILRHALKQLGPLPIGTLLLIDPITPFLGGNLMDYDACLVGCTLLRRLCREFGFTIIGVCHAGKQKNDKKEQYRRLQDRIVGSTAQFGFSDTQMYLASPEEVGQPFYTFLWHPHHRPPQYFQLGRTADGLFVPYGEGKAEQEHNKVLDAIPDADSDGIGFGELIVASEVPKTSVWRVLQDALKNGSIERVGHGKYRKARLN